MNEWQVRTVDNLVSKGGRIVVIMPEESEFEPVVPIRTYDGSRTIYRRNAYVLGEVATTTRVVTNASAVLADDIPTHDVESWRAFRCERDTMALSNALFKELDK